ncbi:peptide deformylase [Fodinibius roseus]|uniref:Peptide deformylase n=1 Tax=Fodinibius roseus TaxID=1194090 RepID=A0A1M5ERU4_9BACT|nr:peptide deformylase [Fodinibius roseus]SHF81732.1 peptide deformylase [Fodinibius roseus]
MMLPIRAYGDPILHKQAKPVSQNSTQIQQLIDSMIQTMRHADGAGLAAPQVGKPLRIFVANLTGVLSLLPEDEQSQIPQHPMVCINPKVIFSSQKKEEFEEGCLSIPNLPVKVKRPNKVKLHYLDRNFQQQEIEGIGPVASVLQHENDHLDGVLHIDYLSAFRKKLIEGRLNQIKKGNFEADYPMQIGN